MNGFSPPRASLLVTGRFYGPRYLYWQDPSPQEIIDRLVPKVENGSIILMHPKANTVKALPRLIEGAAGEKCLTSPRRGAPLA